MRKVELKIKTLVALMLSISMMTISVCAEGVITPYFNNVSRASVSIGFDTNNVVYCGLSLAPYSHCTGVSGLMRLYDSDDNCLKIWSVSDYESPFLVENTYQGVYGETYTVTFTGYAYSNNGTAADRLELSVEGTCVDAD